MKRDFLYSIGRALTLALALSGVQAIKLSAQLSVDELEVFLRTGNAPRTGTIRVTNLSAQAVQALVEIQDWDRDEQGLNRFHPLGQEAHSCRERLKVFPLSLRIEPGRTETVRLSFDGGAGESCWGVVFIQSNQPATSGAQSQITYVVRTGIKVYVEPAAATREGDIESVQIVHARRRDASAADTVATPHFEIAVKSSGTAHLKAKGVIEIRSADNVSIAKLPIDEFPMVPGALRKLLIERPRLAPGRYIALVLIDYSGPEIAAGQLEFEVR